MNESQLYEAVGRETLARKQAEANFDTAIQCIADILSGALDPTRVIVDLTNKSVSWVAPGERPPMPAQINGVPVCVVDKDKDGRTKAELIALVAALEDRVRTLEATPKEDAPAAVAG